MRIYAAVPERLADFTTFFLDHLLPVQLRHGARLVGRWSTPQSQVIAIWEYDSEADYERIQASVAADPASAVAQRRRRELGPLFTSRVEQFMVSTLPE